jgi:hypothetical protein
VWRGDLVDFCRLDRRHRRRPLNNVNLPQFVSMGRQALPTAAPSAVLAEALLDQDGLRKVEGQSVEQSCGSSVCVIFGPMRLRGGRAAPPPTHTRYQHPSLAHTAHAHPHFIHVTTLSTIMKKASTLSHSTTFCWTRPAPPSASARASRSRYAREKEMRKDGLGGVV